MKQIGAAVGIGPDPCFAMAATDANAMATRVIGRMFLMPGSNIREVTKWLKDIVESFNFNRKGVDQSLGRDLCHVVAWEIAARSADGKDADGNAWPTGTNEELAKQKVENYGWPDPPPTNYRTAQMLSHLSLLGRPSIRDHDIEMVYGLDQGPQGGCWSPTDARTDFQRTSDDSVTDVQKAGWAHERERGFYAADDVMEAAVIEAAGDALETYLREVN